VNDGPLYGFISILKNRNYNLVYGVIPALWYGVPQTRERFVLMASLESQIHLPERTHNGTDIPFATVRDWIGNIPSIEAGESHPLVKDHVSAKLSELNLKRIRCTPEGIMIDGCVARLRKYKPEEYELIIAHFIIGISLRSIAKKLKCSDGTIRKELHNAMGFIEGVLMML
ncbi:hypothetical protein G4C93_29105, partial [Klebsiella pneumoniae]|nr:hypothetical protein [Klebsiella pneumoniae]